ncbi:MAG: SH3 domain-containing protein [Anaerolineales bacterium]|nr:SH3 domain-containing protein [Anaerolineales bacterium]
MNSRIKQLKRWAWMAAFLALALIFSARSVAVRAADDRWRARYWNNRDFSGNPALERNETTLDHDWGRGSPGDEVQDDNFTARWTRNIYFATSGVYRFSASMDDGMRVWVDDSRIIDSWYDSQVHTVVADVYLSAGDHHVKVDYYEATGSAIAQLSWALASGANTVNWRGEYYNNRTLTGQPTLVRDDGSINFNWGLGRPADGINADEFSVRWTRTVPLDAGVYRFATTTDDGVRLWVNNQLVIDQWHDQAATSYSADVSVPGGNVPVKMEYYDNRDYAAAQLNWERIAAPVLTSTPPPTAVSALPPWTGTYYNNTNLDESPVLVRQDPEIAFIWGSSSPLPNVVSPDHFSVRWTTTANLPAGQYRFDTFVDGGVRLWVNEQLIIDEWHDYYEVRNWANVVNLPGGPVPLRMEFFDDVGLAEARLVIQPQGGTIPLNPTPPGSAGGPLTATVINAQVLNVRSGPGMEFDPFSHVAGGEIVNLTGYRSNGWVQIRLLDGRTGWVGGAYLTGYNYDELSLWSGT